MKPSKTKGLSNFQLLTCRVEILYEDPALENALCYLVERARQAFEIRKILTYEARGTGPYDLFEEGDFLARVETRADVVHVIYGRVYRRVLDRCILSGWVVLHGAVATINGSRTLFLAHKGSGKTTLAARLLYSGHAVEGDEMVLVRDGQVLALPRRFHFKPDIERHVPELSGAVKPLPKAMSGTLEISAFDPSESGFDWKIGIGPVDRVFWIEKNHGGETSIAQQSSFATIQCILEASLGWGEARDVLVANATRLGRAGGYVLTLGNVEEAARLL